jgi:hypothetical protein
LCGSDFRSEQGMHMLQLQDVWILKIYQTN